MKSNEARGHRPVGNRVTARGVHAFDTEARTIEQAVDIIRWQQIKKRQADTLKGKKRSLRQEFALAKFVALSKKNAGKISLAGGMTSTIKRPNSPKPKTPHPFLDLPDDKKQQKCREMYDSGCWGIGVPAFRRLAKVFKVTVGQVLEWNA
jgi:hypothetical protein